LRGPTNAIQSRHSLKYLRSGIRKDQFESIGQGLYGRAKGIARTGVPLHRTRSVTDTYGHINHLTAHKIFTR